MTDFFENFRFLENPALKEILNEKKIEISMAEDDLNGTERFAATQVMSSEECQVLIKLANVSAPQNTCIVRLYYG